jgi:hypothetical protein
MFDDCLATSITSRHQNDQAPFENQQNKIMLFDILEKPLSGAPTISKASPKAGIAQSVPCFCGSTGT